MRPYLGIMAPLILFLLLYVAPLGVRPLGSPDEVRYAEIPREMLASGDWVAPRFNGVRYFEKPVLGYWINAASLSALGENPFALRLPVALATALTALIVFVMTRRYVTPSSAPLAACIYLSTLLVAGVGSFAVFDPFLTLFVTTALASWYTATTEPRGARRLGALAVCGVACAAAFLTKGFIAWAIPVIVAGPYLIVRRQWRTLFVTSLLPIAVAVALVVPWAVLVHLREPDFWHYFFWIEHVQRFAGQNAQHARPFWYYAAMLPVTGWPWILLLPAAAASLRAAPAKSFLWYAACWSLIPLLFFSVAKGKLLTYILPCFVPLSILIAAGLEQYCSLGGRRAFRIAAAAFAAVFLAALVAVVVGQSGAIGVPLYAAGEWPKLVGLFAFLGAGLGASAAAYWSARPLVRLTAIAVVGAAVVLPLHLVVPERVIENLLPVTVVSRHASASPATVLVADASLFGTTAWALKRDDIYLVSPGEIEYGLSYPEAKHRWLEGRMLEELVARNRGQRDVLVICDVATVREIDALLPANTERAQYGTVALLRIPQAD